MPPSVSRAQILAFRRRAGLLVGRQPRSADALQRAAWAGLQDSMPRAALLSLHARVADIDSATLDDPALAQLWGPRHSTYVVAQSDFAVFSLGRMPEAAKQRERAERMAAKLHALLGGATMREHEVGKRAGINPNAFKYGAPTGTIAIRWDGARSPLVWSVNAPTMATVDAADELARRYLRIFGPATAESFGRWAGVGSAAARKTFARLEPELVTVSTPLGEAQLLATDEAELQAGHPGDAPARLLPSGDAYILLWGADRELLVPDAVQRERLWTTRVWPGAVLVDGEIRGTWRRASHTVTLEPWSRLTSAQRAAVEAEAAALPLPGLDRDIAAVWS